MEVGFKINKSLPPLGKKLDGELLLVYITFASLVHSCNFSAISIDNVILVCSSQFALPAGNGSVVIE